VLLWSTPLNGGGGRGGGGRQGAAGAGARAGGQPTPAGPFPVDPAQGVRTAPPPVEAAAAGTPAAGAPGQPNRGFIAFEPMVGITDAMNMAQKGLYKELQSIPPGGSWEESFWITTRGY
jgi:aldose 1-epimerase